MIEVDVFEERNQRNAIEFLRRNLETLRKIAGLSVYDTMRILNLENKQSIYLLEREPFSMTEIQYFAWLSILDDYFLCSNGFLEHGEIGSRGVLRFAMNTIKRKYYMCEIAAGCFKEFEKYLSLAATFKEEGKDNELAVLSANIEDLVFKVHTVDTCCYD